MSLHVAVVNPQFVEPILRGRKIIECRLTRTAMAPFGCITPGQRIYFKQSAGPFFATAVCDRVWMTDRLTPPEVDKLRRQFDRHILGGEFWDSRRDTARYGTLIWLRDVRPSTLRPVYKPQNMRAWYVLDDEADPMNNGAAHTPPARTNGTFEIALTAGALRQSAVRIAKFIDHLPPDCIGGRTRTERGKPIRLLLDGGDTVDTDIVGPQKMLRWRGWRRWFNASSLQQGDRLRFTPQGPRTFRVQAVRK